MTEQNNVACRFRKSYTVTVQKGEESWNWKNYSLADVNDDHYDGMDLYEIHAILILFRYDKIWRKESLDRRKDSIVEHGSRLSLSTPGLLSRGMDERNERDERDEKDQKAEEDFRELPWILLLWIHPWNKISENFTFYELLQVS